METVLLVCNDPEDKVFLREFIDCYWELEPKHRDVYDKAGTQCTRVYLEEPLPKAGIKKALSKRQPKKVPGKRQPWYPDPEDVRPDFCEVPWPLPSCYTGSELYESLVRATKAGTLKVGPDEYGRPTDLLASVEDLGYATPAPLQSIRTHESGEIIAFSSPQVPATLPLDKWLTVSKAAHRMCEQMDDTMTFGVAKTHISKACNKGAISCIEKGRLRRVNQDSLDSHILKLRNESLEEDSDLRT